MKVAVIGTGGVGGYFGGKMARAGIDVTFVARGDHMLAMQKSGLKVKSINGDFTVHPVNITAELADLEHSDLIILSVKAWQVRNIAERLRSIIKPGATILPLQNGVMAFDEVAGELGKQHVIGGLCRIISKIEAPGVIAHLGIEPVIIFGEMDNSKTERVLKIREIFEKSGIQCKIAENIKAELWKKFISICASGLLAVTRSTYGEVREMPETRNMMIALFEEIYALSQKSGISISADFVSKTLAFVDSFPPDSTSSLTRDVWDGKPSEIEYQNGTVVRLGEKHGVDTPVNRYIYYCILPMEKRAREVFGDKT